MSDKDVKRPQRIWSAEELGGKPQLPAKPTRTPTQSGERFSRLLLPSKPMENNGEVALRPGAPTLHTGLAKRSMALARKSDHDGESADACLPAQTESGAAAVLSQHQTVVQALPTAWSQAEAVHQAWCDSVQSAPTLEQMLAQRWPQEVADAAAMLCQRAGDQFTGWCGHPHRSGRSCGDGAVAGSFATASAASVPHLVGVVRSPNLVAYGATAGAAQATHRFVAGH